MQLVPRGTQALVQKPWLSQLEPLEHALHATPLSPQALVDAPPWHRPVESQQPAQLTDEQESAPPPPVPAPPPVAVPPPAPPATQEPWLQCSNKLHTRHKPDEPQAVAVSPASQTPLDEQHPVQVLGEQGADGPHPAKKSSSREAKLWRSAAMVSGLTPQPRSGCKPCRPIAPSHTPEGHRSRK
jgi:hypothetical protein